MWRRVERSKFITHLAKKEEEEEGETIHPTLGSFVRSKAGWQQLLTREMRRRWKKGRERERERGHKDERATSVGSGERSHGFLPSSYLLQG